MDGETERQMEEVITQLGPFTSLSLERYTHITRYSNCQPLYLIFEHFLLHYCAKGGKSEYNLLHYRPKIHTNNNVF